MNKRLVLRLTGNVLMVEGALLLIPLIVSFIYGDGNHDAFLYAMLLVLALGYAFSLARPRNENLRAREGFAVVAMSWICVSFFGGLPFWFSGWIPSLVDCFFEAVSGFTTTGASILTDVEALPKSLLFWRSFTHWAGGMGVLVLSLALIPKMGARSIYLMRAESPGPSPDKLVPRVGKTAKILYEIYIGMSLLMIVVLLLLGLDWFDALTHTFGAAGTGGFSIYADSIAHYGSPLIETVIGVFTALFGVNFAVYYAMLQKNWRGLWRNSELRTYVLIIFAATLLIALNILPLYGNRFFQALRYSFFQVSSIITTTGYATADFDLWPQLSRFLLVMLMLVGACAGSTGGGIKVVRCQILFKNLVRDIRRTIHPKAVYTVKLDGRNVDESVISAVTGFFFAYAAIAVISTAVISLDGFGFETNVTAVIATLSNIGPGLGLVGPTGSFAMYSPASKLILSLCMLIGRLEIFPILMLMLPSAWQR